MTCLKCIFSHCALLLRELPEAVAEKTRNAIHLFPGYSTPRWTSNQFHSVHQSHINVCPTGMRRNWLFYNEKTTTTKKHPSVNHKVAQSVRESGGILLQKGVLWAQSLSHVRLFETLWTVAHQALLSIGFSR